MDEKFDTAEKKVLVEIVKLAQKRGMQGTKGGWKEFLNTYDRKLGNCLSDPSRRSNGILVAFLKTFTKEDDLKFFAKVMQCHSNRNMVEQFTKKSSDNESPEQRLVRLTLEHPQYPLDYSFPSHDEDWVVTNLSRESKVIRSDSMVAVDCEMVLCEDGSDALVKVCVVDRSLQVKLNELVNPNKAVVDYRTDITGVAAGDLSRVTCSLADIQKSMKKLLSHGTILVGHSLNNDLQALKLDHARVIDTSYIFKYSDGPVHRRPSLNILCKSVLGYEVRKKGAPHNCLDDARAAMKLVLAKIERGVDNTIPLVQENVPEVEMAKLLLHRIPIGVASEELQRVIPGDFTVEIKSSKKARRENYTALAIFKDPQDAHQAFENVKGSQEKDSSGRPQKLVTFQLSTGVIASLYVRKMAHDDSFSQVLSKKRSFQPEEVSGESKKLMTDQIIKEEKMADANQVASGESKKVKRDQIIEEKMADANQCHQCADHLKEIESLKEELRHKDFLISALNKMKSNNSKGKKKRK